MRKFLKISWSVSSKLLALTAMGLTCWLVGWNEGHEIGYRHALADTILDLVDPETFIMDWWRSSR